MNWINLILIFIANERIKNHGKTLKYYGHRMSILFMYIGLLYSSYAEVLFIYPHLLTTVATLNMGFQFVNFFGWIYNGCYFVRDDGGCKHVVALMFALANFAKCSAINKFTSMDVLCSWNRPCKLTKCNIKLDDIDNRYVNEGC